MTSKKHNKNFREELNRALSSVGGSLGTIARNQSGKKLSKDVSYKDMLETSKAKIEESIAALEQQYTLENLKQLQQTINEQVKKVTNNFSAKYKKTGKKKTEVRDLIKRESEPLLACLEKKMESFEGQGSLAGEQVDIDLIATALSNTVLFELLKVLKDTATGALRPMSKRMIDAYSHLSVHVLSHTYEHCGDGKTTMADFKRLYLMLGEGKSKVSSYISSTFGLSSAEALVVEEHIELALAKCELPTSLKDDVKAYQAFMDAIPEFHDEESQVETLVLDTRRKAIAEDGQASLKQDEIALFKQALQEGKSKDQAVEYVNCEWHGCLPYRRLEDFPGEEKETNIISREQVQPLKSVFPVYFYLAIQDYCLGLIETKSAVGSEIVNTADTFSSQYTVSIFTQSKFEESQEYIEKRMKSARDSDYSMFTYEIYEDNAFEFLQEDVLPLMPELYKVFDVISDTAYRARKKIEAGSDLNVILEETLTEIEELLRKHEEILAGLPWFTDVEGASMALLRSIRARIFVYFETGLLTARGVSDAKLREIHRDRKKYNRQNYTKMRAELLTDEQTPMLRLEEKYIEGIIEDGAIFKMSRDKLIKFVSKETSRINREMFGGERRRSEQDVFLCIAAKLGMIEMGEIKQLFGEKSTAHCEYIADRILAEGTYLHTTKLSKKERKLFWECMEISMCRIIAETMAAATRIRRTSAGLEHYSDLERIYKRAELYCTRTEAGTQSYSASVLRLEKNEGKKIFECSIPNDFRAIAKGFTNETFDTFDELVDTWTAIYLEWKGKMKKLPTEQEYQALEDALVAAAEEMEGLHMWIDKRHISYKTKQFFGRRDGAMNATKKAKNVPDLDFVVKKMLSQEDPSSEELSWCFKLEYRRAFAQAVGKHAYMKAEKEAVKETIEKHGDITSKENLEQLIEELKNVIETLYYGKEDIRNRLDILLLIAKEVGVGADLPSFIFIGEDKIIRELFEVNLEDALLSDEPVHKYLPALTLIAETPRNGRAPHKKMLEELIEKTLNGKGEVPDTPSLPKELLEKQAKVEKITRGKAKKVLMDHAKKNLITIWASHSAHVIGTPGEEEELAKIVNVIVLTYKKVQYWIKNLNTKKDIFSQFTTLIKQLKEALHKAGVGEDDIKWDTFVDRLVPHLMYPVYYMEHVAFDGYSNDQEKYLDYILHAADTLTNAILKDESAAVAKSFRKQVREIAEQKDKQAKEEWEKKIVSPDSMLKVQEMLEKKDVEKTFTSNVKSILTRMEMMRLIMDESYKLIEACMTPGTERTVAPFKDTLTKDQWKTVKKEIRKFYQLLAVWSKDTTRVADMKTLVKGLKSKVDKAFGTSRSGVMIEGVMSTVLEKITERTSFFETKGSMTSEEYKTCKEHVKTLGADIQKDRSAHLIRAIEKVRKELDKQATAHIIQEAAKEAKIVEEMEQEIVTYVRLKSFPEHLRTKVLSTVITSLLGPFAIHLEGASREEFEELMIHLDILRDHCATAVATVRSKDTVISQHRHIMGSLKECLKDREWRGLSLIKTIDRLSIQVDEPIQEDRFADISQVKEAIYARLVEQHEHTPVSEELQNMVLSAVAHLTISSSLQEWEEILEELAEQCNQEQFIGAPVITSSKLKAVVIPYLLDHNAGHITARLIGEEEIANIFASVLQEGKQRLEEEEAEKAKILQQQELEDMQEEDSSNEESQDHAEQKEPSINPLLTNRALDYKKRYDEERSYLTSYMNDAKVLEKRMKAVTSTPEARITQLEGIAGELERQHALLKKAVAPSTAGGVMKQRNDSRQEASQALLPSLEQARIDADLYQLSLLIHRFLRSSAREQVLLELFLEDYAAEHMSALSNAEEFSLILQLKHLMQTLEGAKEKLIKRLNALQMNWEHTRISGEQYTKQQLTEEREEMRGLTIGLEEISEGLVAMAEQLKGVTELAPEEQLNLTFGNYKI